jgi:hypothetical protein
MADEKKERPALFDKIDSVFTKKRLTKEAVGSDGFMILRALSMRPEYVEQINAIQKYQGVLGWRIATLLQHMFSEADRAPFLDYAKRPDQYARFSPRATGILCKLFGVSKRRLEEYLPNLWVTEEELNEIYGLQ